MNEQEQPVPFTEEERAFIVTVDEPESGDAPFDANAWTSTIGSILDDNPDSPEVPEALRAILNGSERITVGGGAAGLFRYSRATTRRVSLPSYGLVIEIDIGASTGRIVGSELHELNDDAETTAAFDAIESIVLGHACAGVDVCEPAYLEGLETAIGALLAQHG